jgi:hypothetical protein
VLPWEAFIASVTEAEKLGQSEEFDYLRYIGDGYLPMRRYTPELLDVLDLRAAPAAQDVLDAVNVLRAMNASGQRVVPKDAPTDFVRKRWESLVLTDGGVDRRFYELCALSELKNALRSGDIWVRGSRQFTDFNEYLLPAKQFSMLKESRSLALPIEIDGDRYLHDRLALLEQRLDVVNALAAADELPDAVITESGLKVTPLPNSVPADADELARQAYALLPRIKITELLMEVDAWTGFTRHFTHVKTGESAADRALLLTVILADAINLGLTKMSDSCPGTTYAKLSWLQAWHIREDTYSAALADLVNAQFVHPFAAHWGDPCDERQTLSVLYNPNSLVTPSRAIFYQATRQSESRELAAFTDLVAREIGGLPPQYAFPSWEAALEFVTERAGNERIVVILDEYPYLTESTRGLSSILQRWWDRSAQSSRVMLVLCGSEQAVMDDLDRGAAPLHQRFTLKLRLEALAYDEAAELLPRLDAVDCVRVYAILGGTPLYVREWDTTATLRANLLRLFGDPRSALVDAIRLALPRAWRVLRWLHERFVCRPARPPRGSILRRECSRPRSCRARRLLHTLRTSRRDRKA